MPARRARRWRRTARCLIVVLAVLAGWQFLPPPAAGRSQGLSFPPDPDSAPLGVGLHAMAIVLASLRSAAVFGVDAYPVQIEVDV